MKSPRVFAVVVVGFFCLIMWLNIREFVVLSNTLEIKSLVIGSMLGMLLLTGSILWYYRKRFTPLERHFPEVVMMLIFSILFGPMLGSLLNRSWTKAEEQSFEFVSETGYYASAFGFLKGEKMKPSGWRLTVREGQQEHRLKYKSQAYFPLSKPGDKIRLPVRKGILGVRVVQLR